MHVYVCLCCDLRVCMTPPSKLNAIYCPTTFREVLYLVIAMLARDTAGGGVVSESFVHGHSLSDLTTNAASACEKESDPTSSYLRQSRSCMKPELLAHRRAGACAHAHHAPVVPHDTHTHNITLSAASAYKAHSHTWSKRTRTRMSERTHTSLGCRNAHTPRPNPTAPCRAEHRLCCRGSPM